MGRKALPAAEKLGSITCIRLRKADAAKIAKLRKKAKTQEERRRLNDALRDGLMEAIARYRAT